MNNTNKQIVIIGGGITGLSTAYYLQKEITRNQLPFNIKLVEASNRLGGKIRTLQRDGFTIEQGADSMLIRKKPAVKLVKELGLENEIVRNATGKSYILANHKFHRIPKDTFMEVLKRYSLGASFYIDFTHRKNPCFSRSGKSKGGRETKMNL